MRTRSTTKEGAGERLECASSTRALQSGSATSARQGTNWHHAPPHLFVPDSIYMVTGATLYKEHFHRGSERLRLLERAVFDVVAYRGWELRAWALFSNHYHLILRAPEEDGDLGRLVQHLHSEAAKALNRFDGTKGRRVWRQYWDTGLTFESSYYARLNYVMHNPVRHGLVPAARLYPFCSASWFERNSTSAFRRRLASYKFDDVNIHDDFDLECASSTCALQSGSETSARQEASWGVAGPDKQSIVATTHAQTDQGRPLPL